MWNICNASKYPGPVIATSPGLILNGYLTSHSLWILFPAADRIACDDDPALSSFNSVFVVLTIPSIYLNFKIIYVYILLHVRDTYKWTVIRIETVMAYLEKFQSLFVCTRNHLSTRYSGNLFVWWDLILLFHACSSSLFAIRN